MMGKPQKFLFDISFDPVVETPPDENAIEALKDEGEFEEVPPPPSFSEEDLEAAREAAFAAGHEAGLEAGRQSAEAQTLAAVQSVAGQIGTLFTAHDKAVDAMLADAAEIAVTAARKIAPAYARIHGTEEIEALVRQTIVNLLDEPRVVVRLHPDTRDALEERLTDAARRSGFENQLVLLPDEQLAPDDSRIEWASGGAERLTQEVWQQIDDVLARFVRRLEPGPAARDTVTADA